MMWNSLQGDWTGLKAAKENENIGKKAAHYPVDVDDAKSVEDAAEKAELELGPTDVGVNNAVKRIFSPIKNGGRRVQMDNRCYLSGAGKRHPCRSKKELPRDKGSILFVSSAFTYRGIPPQPPYCGVKYAVEGFFNSLQTELMHDKIKVSITIVQFPALNTTQFGYLKTRLPNKPKLKSTIYQPEVTADAIVNATDHDRREIM